MALLKLKYWVLKLHMTPSSFNDFEVLILQFFFFISSQMLLRQLHVWLVGNGSPTVTWDLLHHSHETNNEEVAARNKPIQPIPDKRSSAGCRKYFIHGEHWAVNIDKEISGNVRDFYFLGPCSLLLQQTLQCQIPSCLGEDMCSLAPHHTHLTPANVESRHAAELNVIHATQWLPMRREAGRTVSVSSENVSSLPKPSQSGALCGAFTLKGSQLRGGRWRYKMVVLLEQHKLIYHSPGVRRRSLGCEF